MSHKVNQNKTALIGFWKYQTFCINFFPENDNNNNISPNQNVINVNIHNYKNIYII